MNYYLDIQLRLPDAEANYGFIWQKVFQQVHFALVEHGYDSGRKLKHGDTKTLRNSKIAVSFPEYKNHPFPLGSKLRLYAQTEVELQKLAIEKWLNRLVDYLTIAEIQPVSAATKFVAFKQKRVKGEKRSAAAAKRKQDHLIKVFGENFNPEYANLNLNSVFEKIKLPFIQIESQTSKQKGEYKFFQIFIEPAEDLATDSLVFDCYGLRITGHKASLTDTTPH